jgi:hypothetical protein
MKSAKKCQNIKKENEKKPKISQEQAKKLANRLIGYLKVKEKKINLLKKTEEKTFEKFFTPKIIKNRPKSLKTPEKKKPNFDFIKNNWKKILKIPDPNEKKCTKSSLIIDLKKKKRLKEIFDILNPINKKISLKFIDFARVPRDLLKIICPLLEELAEVDEGLEFPDFVTAMENLMKMISIDEKSVILDTKKKCLGNIFEPSFKPSLSCSSIKVRGNLLERSRSFVVEKERKIEEKQKEKLRADLSSCTFSPKTSRFDRSLFNISLV